MERGKRRLTDGQAEAALRDFEAAVTYPDNLGVGRTDKPEHAAAQYWRGRALEALGRIEEAHAAWEQGAAGSPGSENQNQHREMCRAALQAGG